MIISYEIYDLENKKTLLKGNDFNKLYDYIMYNGIQYIFNGIEYDVFDKNFISFTINLNNNIRLFLNVEKM